MKIPMLIEKCTKKVITDRETFPFTFYEKKDARCMNYNDVKVGDKLHIVSGRKIKKDDIVEVLRVAQNKFEHKENVNPCLLVKTSDNQEVWTNGINCVKVDNFDKIVTTQDEFDFAAFDIEKLGYVSDKKIWYLSKDSKVCSISKSFDLEFEVLNFDGKTFLQKLENSIVALYKSSHDKVFLVRFNINYVPGNQLKLEQFATEKEAIEAFEKEIKS